MIKHILKFLIGLGAVGGTFGAFALIGFGIHWIFGCDALASALWAMMAITLGLVLYGIGDTIYYD